MKIFFLQFALTNILFPGTIVCVMKRWDHTNSYSWSVLGIISLGLGPASTSLILYYSLLFIPRRSNSFYIVVVLAVFMVLGWLGRSQAAYIIKALGSRRRRAWNRFLKFKTREKIASVFFAIILIAAAGFVLFINFKTTLQFPLDEYDALRYATQGKILYQEKAMEYRWINPYPKNGFYGIVHAAPSFPLLLTWEKMTGDLFGSDQDLYFKSISPFYALLILAGVVAWLRPRSKALALSAVAVLISYFPFFVTLFQQHVDSYRIFLLMVSWYFLSSAVGKGDRLSLAMYGISTGFAAFAHTIGAIFALFSFVALLIFLKKPLGTKVKTAGVVAALIFGCGWVHYLLDTLWGFGWIIYFREHTFWG